MRVDTLVCPSFSMLLVDITRVSNIANSTAGSHVDSAWPTYQDIPM